MKKNRITLLRKSLNVQYIRNGVIYSSEDHIVWESHDNGKNWNKVCQLPISGEKIVNFFKDKILRSAVIRKLRRNIGIHNVVVLKSGTIIIQYDKIYRFDGNGKYAKPVFDITAKNIYGPMKNGLAYDEKTDSLYFGEYVISRPYAVRIFRGTGDGRFWERCYDFPVGRIRHIHSIIPDKYRNRIWVCAGDNNHESGLFYTDDDFKTVHVFGQGDQSWRMVSLIPIEDAIIWGSDAGQDAAADDINFIYKWDFHTNKRQKLMCIDKPAYFTTRLSSGLMVLGTTYEPEIRRKIDPTADIWISYDGVDWQKKLTLEYCKAKRNYGTRYALLHFPSPSSVSGDSLIFTPFNTIKYDFCALKLGDLNM